MFLASAANSRLLEHGVLVLDLKGRKLSVAPFSHPSEDAIGSILFVAHRKALLFWLLVVRATAIAVSLVIFAIFLTIFLV